MKLHFHKSFWEVPCEDRQQLEALLVRLVAQGYQGSELFLPFYTIDAATTLAAHQQHGLAIVAGIATEGDNLQQHLTSLERQVEQAAQFEPCLINCHTGRDIFSLDENMRLFERALQLEQEYGVTLTHETHRFRPTFSTFNTEQIVQRLPELKLNLDVSHWMVVHESDLSDQAERLQLLLSKAWHIHARVGFEEGPQVTDPQDPRWQAHLHNHTRLWQQVVNFAKARAQDVFTITPEFGPFPYAHMQPYSEACLTDIWAANHFMQQHLLGTLVS